MNSNATIVIMALLSYLSGSIPFGHIISKSIYKKDIRSTGSGNTGATNVLRTLGKLPGSITLFLDAMKGYIPALAGLIVFNYAPLWPCVFGLLSILGHTFNPFFKFRGGKGVATGLGVFLALTPKALLIGMVVFLAFFIATRYVSLGSLSGVLGMAVSSFFIYPSEVLRIFTITVVVLIFIRHHSNIRRLLAGNENKIKFS